MFPIVPGIGSLEQHFEHLEQQPQSYRPQRCPHFGKAGLWCHGRYERKAPRGEGVAFALDGISIPRFLCPHCRRSCSRLPACIAPLRQYLWKLQQAVLERLLAGESIRQVAQRRLGRDRPLRPPVRMTVYGLLLGLQVLWALAVGFDCSRISGLCFAPLSTGP